MITALQAFYEINRPIFEFGYGLSFFVLGLVVALQSHRSSRLALARTLGWLAAFGIAHGLFEWGEHFARSTRRSSVQPGSRCSTPST